jgi:hypothetical protein
MLQLHNRSPFVAQVFVLPDAQGVETIVVVIKATFRIGARLELAEKQRELVLGDEYWGEPGASSLRYPTEVHPSKPGTDVLVLGEACAPRERPVTELDVVIRVAGRSLQARVYGDRYWTESLAPSRPQPFVRMPLRYERAYGGREPETNDDGSYRAEPRNPVGLGFVGRRDSRQLLGHPVPNLDDPRQPLTKLGQVPVPVGFTAIAPSWHPRVQHAGTYDARWQKTRAPHLPTDFDPRFFNTAPSELNFAAGLRGGEPVSIVGCHPGGPCELTLPECRFELMVEIAGEREQPPLALDAVILEPTDECLTMAWRAIVPVGERVLQVENVEVALAELRGATDPGGRA